MAKNISTQTLGSFCWFELGTTDQNAAKSFYKSLFGWEPVDMPMGPDATYTMFRVQGRDVSGGYTLMEEMRKNGVPPHWALYVAVESANDAASKAAAAGGAVVAPPFDVFDIGRMTAVRDPTGAMINFWQEKRKDVNRITEVPGCFCWADLCTRDVEAAARFYGAVLGWQLTKSETDSSGYLHIKNGEAFIGGVPPSQMLPPGVPPHWLLYYYVVDADTSTKRLQELGGVVHMGPMNIEKVGRMSVVADPQGAVFALFAPMPH
jgi:predicted enzyme related to lactoylglutathione lyase